MSNWFFTLYPNGQMISNNTCEILAPVTIIPSFMKNSICVRQNNSSALIKYVIDRNAEYTIEDRYRDKKKISIKNLIYTIDHNHIRFRHFWFDENEKLRLTLLPHIYPEIDGRGTTCLGVVNDSEQFISYNLKDNEKRYRNNKKSQALIDYFWRQIFYNEAIRTNYDYKNIIVNNLENSICQNHMYRTSSGIVYQKEEMIYICCSRQLFYNVNHDRFCFIESVDSFFKNEGYVRKDIPISNIMIRNGQKTKTMRGMLIDDKYILNVNTIEAIPISKSSFVYQTTGEVLFDAYMIIDKNSKSTEFKKLQSRPFKDTLELGYGRFPIDGEYSVIRHYSGFYVIKTSDIKVRPNGKKHFFHNKDLILETSYAHEVLSIINPDHHLYETFKKLDI